MKCGRFYRLDGIAIRIRLVLDEASSLL